MRYVLILSVDAGKTNYSDRLVRLLIRPPDPILSSTPRAWRTGFEKLSKPDHRSDYLGGPLTKSIYHRHVLTKHAYRGHLAEMGLISAKP